jgi:hypothetical protein
LNAGNAARHEVPRPNLRISEAGRDPPGVARPLALGYAAPAKHHDMEPTLKNLILTTLVLASSPAIAGNWYCHTNKVTDAKTCYANVKERGDGIRTADMATGGPAGVTPNGHSFAINCATGYVHLKDREGVSYGGGDRKSTPALDSIVGWICSADVKKKK